MSITMGNTHLSMLNHHARSEKRLNLGQRDYNRRHEAVTRGNVELFEVRRVTSKECTRTSCHRVPLRQLFSSTAL
eukprot:2797600-Amphidinium_carterae.1